MYRIIAIVFFGLLCSCETKSGGSITSPGASQSGMGNSDPLPTPAIAISAVPQSDDANPLDEPRSATTESSIVPEKQISQPIIPVQGRSYPREERPVMGYITLEGYIRNTSVSPKDGLLQNLNLSESSNIEFFDASDKLIPPILPLRAVILGKLSIECRGIPIPQGTRRVVINLNPTVLAKMNGDVNGQVRWDFDWNAVFSNNRTHEEKSLTWGIRQNVDFAGGKFHEFKEGGGINLGNDYYQPLPRATMIYVPEWKIVGQ